MALGIWVPDKESNHCMKCNGAFTLTNRRHHCRRCGLLYCKRCCWTQTKIDGSAQKVRVCNTCKCHVFRLSDAILQYVFGAFLPEEAQCKMLRVCHRFTRLAILPFKMLSGPLSIRFRPPPTSESNVGTSMGRPGKFTNRTPTVMVDSDTGCLNTLRIVDKASMFSRRQWRALQKEIAMLQRCSHPLFVDLYEVVQSPHRVVLVQEPLEGRYLAEVLQRRPRAACCDAVSSSVCRQILQGLHYLHEHAHGAAGRVTADAVFITRDGVVKLTDLSHGAMKVPGEGDPWCLTPSVRSRSGSESPGLSESFCSAIGNTYAHSPISAGSIALPHQRPPSHSPISTGSSAAPSRPRCGSDGPLPCYERRQEGGVTRLTVGSCGVVIFDPPGRDAAPHSHRSSGETARRVRRTPPPLLIPGGADDILRRRSALFSRAADERKYNLSLPLDDGALRSLIAPRLPAPCARMKALDVRACGLLLHEMLTGVAFRKTSTAISEWAGLTEQARFAVSLMTAAPTDDAPLTPHALLKTCDFFLDPENFMPLETLFE